MPRSYFERDFVFLLESDIIGTTPRALPCIVRADEDGRIDDLEIRTPDGRVEISGILEHTDVYGQIVNKAREVVAGMLQDRRKDMM